jgi:hypothetical protein
MADPACSVHARGSESGNQAWRHDCVLEAGDSGGPIVRRGTLAMVALGAGIVSDPGDSRCPAGGMRHQAAPLTHFNVRCANVAVPLTRDIVARVDAARIVVGVQRALIALGYDAGPLGAIDEPRAVAAIRQVQQDMGWPMTGEATCALEKVLWLRISTS